MKYLAAFVMVFMVLLSLTQGHENHRVWNLCKGKKIHNSPFSCKQPECSQLCSNIHPNIRGFGSCRNEVCQCLYFCPANKNARREIMKANKAKASKMASSKSSSSSSSSAHINHP